MALSGTQRRWMRQPSGLVRINEGHWLANRLVFAHTGERAFVWHQLAAPASLPLAPAAGGGTGRLESIQQTAPDATNYNRFDIPAMAGDGLSLVAWQYGVAGATGYNFFSVGRSNASDGARALHRIADETFTARRINTTNSAAGPTQAGFISGKWQHIAGTFTSDTVSAIYVDGVGNEASGNSRPMTTANAVYVAAAWAGSAARNIAGTEIQGIGPSFVITGVMSAEEVARLYAEQLDDPWSVFAPPPIWAPVSAGGGGSTYEVSATEVASASDAVSAILALAAAATEAATATETQATTLTADAPLAEAATGAETAAADLTIAAATTEAATATDAITVIATLAAVLTESASTTDAAVSLMTMVAALTEAASASETVTWGSVTYDVDLTEAASATDSQSAASVLATVLAEGGSAADAITAVQLLGATVTELGSAADAATGVMVMGVSITEAGAASDLWIASIPSAGPAPASRIWLIANESRIWLIPAESRT